MIIDLAHALAGVCAGLFFIIVYLILRIERLKNNLPKPEIRYIDTNGISENPPRQFIETWKGKTLNFQFNKYVVCIPQVTIMEAVNCIQIISGYFLYIHEVMEIKKANEAAQIDRTAAQKAQYIITDKINSMKMMWCYNRAVSYLYYLSISYINKKHGYKKALLNQCQKDFIWTLDVFEQINDFWQTVKKKINLLAAGQTLKQMDGYTSSWSGFRMDKHGNKLIVPRVA